jgi:hypothetical protein
MSPVLLPETRIKRAFAIWLSVCFGWTFFACVWLCSRHSDQKYESRTKDQAKTFSIPGDNDHCGVEPAQGAIPGKQSATDPPHDTVAHAFIKPSQRAGYENSAAPIHIPLSTADPPLGRLCLYRI